MSQPSPEQIGTLLVSCPDRRGIVASLAQLLYGHGANILDADQHTDPVAGQFFQRIRFDLSEARTDRRTLEQAIAETGGRFGMDWRLAYGDQVKRVALFVSRYDHCLYDLLLRHQAGELRCEIPIIVSNHEDLRRVAEQFGVEFRMFPICEGNKTDVEKQEIELLETLGIDLIVLARYMQVLSAQFVSRYPAGIINIHHSFLPAFVGGKPYQQAYERGVKLIGATATTPPLNSMRARFSSREWCGVRIGIWWKISSARDGIWRRSCWPAPCAGISRTGCLSTATRRWFSIDP